MKREVVLGKNFDEPPLTFTEFISIDRSTNMAVYNNFFYNFYNYGPGLASNYELLKNINKELAEELSVVYNEYRLKKQEPEENDRQAGHYYPQSILEKGYQAYLTLRDRLKNDQLLLKNIADYNKNRKVVPDDFAAFFS